MDKISKVARTYWLSCISLCSSVLHLLNRVKSFGGHPVSFQGWVAKLALPGHFTSVSASRIARKDCQNKKTENRVYATRKLSIPNDCITVFHVAVVLIQWRRETRRWSCTKFLSAMFLEGFVERMQSGIRNGESFKYSPVRVFLHCLSKIISNLQHCFRLSLLIMKY